MALDESEQPSLAEDLAALEAEWGLKLPARYVEFLHTRRSGYVGGQAVVGVPLTPGTDSVWGATEYLWLARPEYKGRRIAVQIRSASATTLALDHHERDDPPVLDTSLVAESEESEIAPSFTAFITLSDQNNLVDRLAEAFAGRSIDERLAALSRELGIQLPSRAAELLAMPPSAILANIVLSVAGEPTDQSNVLWAMHLMRMGDVQDTDALVPLLAVDELSYACLRCSPIGGEASADAGSIVRWHIGDVPDRARSTLLDTDLESYINSVEVELASRESGLNRIQKIAEEFAGKHGSGERSRSFEVRPIRLASQNVVVGLAGFFHDSAIDGTRVLAWQTCQVPHLATHEACRGLLGMTLAEAFQAGGTMEVRFDEHPEGRVPAAIRMFGRTRGLAVGSEDPQSISPSEARALFMAVMNMPETLAQRVSRFANEGVLGVERACFVQLAGIWKPIELDFLLAVSGRAPSILRGGVDLLNRRAAQVEFEVARAAVMVGTLFARLSHQDDGEVTGAADVLEDVRLAPTWQMVPEYGAVIFERRDREFAIPWTDAAETIGTSRLLVVPGSSFDVSELERVAAMASEHSAVGYVLVPSDGVIPDALGPNAVTVLRHPDEGAVLDRQIHNKLLACKVGRA